jgi:hypothetical protein
LESSDVLSAIWKYKDYDITSWSATLMEEHGLEGVENRALRGTSGTEREEVTGRWRKFHNGKLHNLYYLPNFFRVIKSRRMRWEGM